MIKKLPTFYDVARPGAAPCARAKAYYRGAAGAQVSRTLNARPLPAPRAPLACRWQIDPMTGALTAHWHEVAPETSSQAPAGSSNGEEDRRRPSPWLAAARGPALRSRIAAKQAA